MLLSCWTPLAMPTKQLKLQFDPKILVLEMCNGDLRSQIDKAGGMFDEQTTTDVLQQLMFGFQEMVSHS
jgi:hypothetical protein